MRIAVYPGSFDPITNGHLDIIRRAAKVYDQVVVGVLNNISKKPVFTAGERCAMINAVTADIPNVTCDIFNGLLVDFAKQKNATVIIKGRGMPTSSSRGCGPCRISSMSSRWRFSIRR